MYTGFKEKTKLIRFKKIFSFQEAIVDGNNCDITLWKKIAKIIIKTNNISVQPNFKIYRCKTNLKTLSVEKCRNVSKIF